MKYKNKLIASALVIGFSLSANAQNNNFTLNGLGRSIITDNQLGGNATEENFQQSGTSGYNLFDLQTNLDVDSNFRAMAILRARSPFGALFGQGTTFEFRLFAMMGNIKNVKYEIGDIRVELSPYTVFNNEVVPGKFYESTLFTDRRAIQEYENFNQGNSWLVQGIAGQHFYSINKEKGSGLGIYAFTSRNTSTNEQNIADRLLSGGNIEYRFNRSLSVGTNVAAFYDLDIPTSELNHFSGVYTGYLKHQINKDNYILKTSVEGGISDYKYSQVIEGETIDSAYQDGFVDFSAILGLKEPKLVFDLNVRSVGVLFTSPSAQTRRINVNAPLFMFTELGNNKIREQLLFDRFTAEDIYNAKVNPNLMAFLPFYNNTNPYGKATPNRLGGELGLATDTSNHTLDAGLRFSYFTEIQGEGVDELRNFMIVSGGAVAHLNKVLDVNRLIDVNAGVRYENTSRDGSVEVNLNSLLVDAGVAVEVFKKVDVLAGLKYFQADGRELIATRNNFNAITAFDVMDVDFSEIIISAGLRARFNKHNVFNVNYNFTDMQNKLNTTTNYNFGQIFVHYRAIF